MQSKRFRKLSDISRLYPNHIHKKISNFSTSIIARIIINIIYRDIVSNDVRVSFSIVNDLTCGFTDDHFLGTSVCVCVCVPSGVIKIPNSSYVRYRYGIIDVLVNIIITHYNMRVRRMRKKSPIVLLYRCTSCRWYPRRTLY
jgi:hypothetical protein